MAITGDTLTRRSMRLRRILSAAHLVLGLTLGLVWALQGLTGAMLVFHREFDRVVTGAWQANGSVSAAEVPLDRTLAMAREKLSGPPESIGVIDGDSSLLTVNYVDPTGNRRGLIIDAANGKILQERNWRPQSPADGNFTRWIYDLHHHLLLGEVGGMLLGLSGLILVLSACWGTYLAWPRRKQWKQAFAVSRWRTRRQRIWGWHRATGLIAGIALIIVALSGASMDFGKQLRAFSSAYLPYRKPFGPTLVQVAEVPIAPQRALEIAREQLPKAAFVALSLPTEKSPVYRVRLRQPGEWRSWSGTSVVTIDPANGEMLDVYDAAAAPWTNRILESAFAIHSGEAAGLGGRLLVMLAGIALPLLYATGLWTWIRRRR